MGAREILELAKVFVVVTVRLIIMLPSRGENAYIENVVFFHILSKPSLGLMVSIGFAIGKS